MSKNRMVSIGLFVGALVIFNVCAYVFHWPIFLW